jgi:hypothetical protein
MEMFKYGWLVAALAAVFLSTPSPGMAQQQAAAERVAALKASLAASQASLRQYQWIETTVVSLNGEEKSRKQEQCYYGADGKLQKVVLNQSAPEPQKRGLRKMIAESKKEELTDYMQQAVSLVRAYVPPDPARIQAVKDAGKVAIQFTQPGKSARLTFSDYLKSGDSLSVDMDLPTNQPLALNVNSYLDSQQDPVTLTVTFGVLQGGITYASGVVLNAPGKNLSVTVQNSGYRKMAP